MKDYFKFIGKSLLLYAIIGIIWTIYEKTVYGQTFPNNRDSMIAGVMAPLLILVIDIWRDLEKKKKEEK
jgi:hypothetical protein